VNGRVGERLVYRGEETSLELIEARRAYAFDADGGFLRLVSFRAGGACSRTHPGNDVMSGATRPASVRLWMVKPWLNSRAGSVNLRACAVND
jgi:hypothetical protein